MKKLLYFLLIALLIFSVSCSGDNSNPGVDPGLDDNGTPVIDDPNSGNSQEATASVVSGLTNVISTIMKEVSSDNFPAPDSFAVGMSAKVEFLDGDTLRLSIVPSFGMESGMPVVETTYTLGDVSGLALTYLAGAKEVREIVYGTNEYNEPGYAYQIDGGEIITEAEPVYRTINSDISLIMNSCRTCRVKGTAKATITGLTVGGEKQNVTAAANVDGSLTVDESTDGVPSVVTVSGGAAVSVDLSGSIAGISDVTIRLNLDDALSFSIPQGGPSTDEVKAMIMDIIRKLPNIGLVITEGELAGNWYLTPETIENFADAIMQ